MPSRNIQCAREVTDVVTKCNWPVTRCVVHFHVCVLAGSGWKEPGRAPVPAPDLQSSEEA